MPAPRQPDESAAAESPAAANGKTAAPAEREGGASKAPVLENRQPSELPVPSSTAKNGTAAPIEREGGEPTLRQAPSQGVPLAGEGDATAKQAPSQGPSGIGVQPPGERGSVSKQAPSQGLAPGLEGGPSQGQSQSEVEEATRRQEEEKSKQRRRKRGRIRELEEIRAELAEKELILIAKQQELAEKEQTLLVLREEVHTLPSYCVPTEEKQLQHALSSGS